MSSRFRNANARLDRQLEAFCKTVCTGKIGWNRQRRKDCRENTMCTECRRRMDTANAGIERPMKPQKEGQNE